MKIWTHSDPPSTRSFNVFMDSPMSPQLLDTDYLIIGSGAVGMAFADVLFQRRPAK